jgi:hypothetical protein
VSSDATIVDAARRFAEAYVVVADLPRDATHAAAELESACHDLIVACGLPCPYCEPGTCPAGRTDVRVGDTPPLLTWDTRPL